jgi:hypothetical protein
MEEDPDEQGGNRVGAIQNFNFFFSFSAEARLYMCTVYTIGQRAAWKKPGRAGSAIRTSGMLIKPLLFYGFRGNYLPVIICLT